MKKLNRVIRSAFLGGGYGSAVGRAHYSAINIDGNYSLSGGCFSADAERSIATAQLYRVGEKYVYEDEDELLAADSTYDLLHILTPPDLHKNTILKALDKNICIVSEKPLVTSVDEALEIRKKLRAKNGFMAVIYNYLGYPMIREMRHKIAHNYLGKIHEVRVKMPQEGFSKSKPDGSPFAPQIWRLKDYSIPTVSLDLGVHVHMLTKYLLGTRPLSVVGFEKSNGNFPGLVDSVNAIATYEDDVVANIWFGKSYLGHKNGLSIEVYGDKGSFTWRQVDPENVKFTDKHGCQHTIDRSSTDIAVANHVRFERFKVGHPSGFVEALSNYYSDIYDAYFTYQSMGYLKSEECFGIDESLEGLLLMDAIHKSSLSSKTQVVETMPR